MSGSSSSQNSPGFYSINLCQHGKGLLASSVRLSGIRMLYSLRGTLQVDLNGRSYTIHPGDLFLILPDELHKLTCKEWDDVAYWDIQFDRELLTAVSQAAKSSSFLFSFTSSGVLGQRLFERSMLVESPVAAMLESLLEEYKNPGVCSKVALCLQLNQICLGILRIWKAQSDEQDLLEINDVYSLNVLQKIFNYVDQEYMNKIEMKTIAAQLNMSYHSFSKFFIAHTGKTFPSYVNEVRLAKAKILLATTGMNITEIAMEVGYASTSHFIQRFRESNQMTPQQFRKEFK